MCKPNKNSCRQYPHFIDITVILAGLFLGACFSACASEVAHKSPASDSTDSEMNQYMLDELKQAIQQTPYSAVIQQTSVDVVAMKDSDPSDEYAEEKHVYHAKVLKTLRGEPGSTIEYFLVTEKGETPSLEKGSVIITLCKNREGYYWPGTGSIFPLNKSTQAVVAKALLSLPQNQTSFSNCN